MMWNDVFDLLGQIIKAESGEYFEEDIPCALITMPLAGPAGPPASCITHDQQN